MCVWVCVWMYGCENHTHIHRHTWKIGIEKHYRQQTQTPLDTVGAKSGTHKRTHTVHKISINFCLLLWNQPTVNLRFYFDDHAFISSFYFINGNSPLSYYLISIVCYITKKLENCVKKEHKENRKSIDAFTYIHTHARYHLFFAIPDTILNFWRQRRRKKNSIQNNMFKHEEKH